MNKPPAFQFYADDFLGGVITLTLEQRGLYITLLCVQWSSGGVTQEDIDGLCHGLKPASLARVLGKFQKGGDGIYRNSRLESEREKQIDWRQKCSRGGQKSGEVRAKGSSTTLQRVVQGEGVVNGQVNGNTPLSTLHSPPSNEDRKERESGNFPQCPPMTRVEFNTLCQLRGVPADCAEWFWNTHDAVNWLDGQKRPIQKVEPLLMRTLASWRANGGDGNGKTPHGAGPVANRPKTPMDLKTIIQAKETLAGDIRKKHCSDVAMGDSWTNDQKKAEFFKLKREIKELNTQISSMA